MMKLRWFQTFDEFGVDSEKELQYWNEEIELWMTINLIEVPESSKYSAMRNEHAY